jgi:light-regulated signal transduction histidine kinase (bacteriophytochrome)/HAMP domain-containing protein
VFIQSDIQTLFARVERYAAIAGIMLFVSLAFALLLSHFARRSIAEPVARLAEVARTVSQEKNYAIRARRGKEEAELAELAEMTETFNEMLKQIEERDRGLQKAHDELERRVEERTAEWVAANKELESFSYSVSHDLRSPLRGIDGFGQALAEDYGHQLDARANSYIQRIRAATQRMGLLIDDLLNLSRVTRAQMQREPVDLSNMAQSIASELIRRDGERKVEWVIASGVEAFGDSRLLHVVLDNLLGNAWKYTSKHSRARIEFGRQGINGSVTYFVKDDGAGFNPEYSQRLFGAFQRLHGAQEFPGTGIGLATVQRIILRHGGRVWAEGAVEHGATFYFTL